MGGPAKKRAQSAEDRRADRRRKATACFLLALGAGAIAGLAVYGVKQNQRSDPPAGTTSQVEADKAAVSKAIPVATNTTAAASSVRAACDPLTAYSVTGQETDYTTFGYGASTQDCCAQQDCPWASVTLMDCTLKQAMYEVRCCPQEPPANGDFSGCGTPAYVAATAGAVDAECTPTGVEIVVQCQPKPTDAVTLRLTKLAAERVSAAPVAAPVTVKPTAAPIAATVVKPTAAPVAATVVKPTAAPIAATAKPTAAIAATAKPTAAPVATKVAVVAPTPVPVKAAATAKPTVAPTVTPTVVAAAVATAKPTVKPVKTVKPTEAAVAVAKVDLPNPDLQCEQKVQPPGVKPGGCLQVVCFPDSIAPGKDFHATIRWCLQRPRPFHGAFDMLDMVAKEPYGGTGYTPGAAWQCGQTTYKQTFKATPQKDGKYDVMFKFFMQPVWGPIEDNLYDPFPNMLVETGLDAQPKYGALINDCEKVETVLWNNPPTGEQNAIHIPETPECFTPGEQWSIMVDTHLETEDAADLRINLMIGKGGDKYLSDEDVFVAESNVYAVQSNPVTASWNKLPAQYWTQHEIVFTAKQTAKVDDQDNVYITAFMVPEGQAYSAKRVGGWTYMERESYLKMKFC